MQLHTLTNQEQWLNWLDQHLDGKCRKKPTNYPCILITSKWEIDFIYPSEIQRKYTELITAVGYEGKT